jgi:uncharacterized protein
MNANPGELPARFEGDALFSYTCHRCRNCCHDKLIQVNPYEVARLARNRGLSTTAFIENHLENSVYLRRQEDGACVFLGPEGCTVHPDRPLVCRLYPLGRHVGPDDEITYSQLEAHPRTEGVYGREGSVAEYISQQRLEAFVNAADRYLATLRKLHQAWLNTPAEPTSEEPPELVDLDRAVAEYCTARSLAEPTDIEERMHLHLQAIECWLEKQN